MRKSFFTTFLFFTFSFIHSQCPTGSINLTTQTQIDNFSTTYPSCTSLLGSISIQGSTITNLNGLNSLTSIAGTLNINNCPNLTTLQGLNNITNINFTFISNCSTLLNLNGLNSLTSTNLSFTNVLNLNSISALSNLTVCDYININNCDALININGLEGITNTGTIEIRNNALLQNIEGLTNLTNVINTIQIVANNSLQNLNGFNSLTSLGYYLEISNNPSLNSIFGLINATQMNNITDPINDNCGILIGTNISLPSLSGLDNLNILVANNFFNLSIYNNSILTNSSFTSICNYLNAGKQSNITSNATGSNSSIEILANCQNLSRNDFEQNSMLIYPNPTKNIINVNTKSEILNIYDNLGRQMSFEKLSNNQISIEKLPKGIYILELQNDNIKTFKKIIKN